MNSKDIIGYTADADSWCNDCAITVYGGKNREHVEKLAGYWYTTLTEDATDTEGNTVHPMFCGEETDSPICCTRCFEPIETTVLDPEGRYSEPDHAPDHDSSECPDCDQRAHAGAGGMGCWCPVCICPNAPGGNDSSDGVECRYCAVTTEPAAPHTKYNPAATHSPSPSEMATLCGLSVFPVSSGRGYINITRNTGAVSCISCRQQLRELGKLPRPIASDVTNP